MRAEAGHDVAQKRLWNGTGASYGPVVHTPMRDLETMKILRDRKMGRVNDADPSAGPTQQFP
jgi:hypothetical protein